MWQVLSSLLIIILEGTFMFVLYTLILTPQNNIELLKSFYPVLLFPELTQLGWLQVEEIIHPDGQRTACIHLSSHPIDSTIHQLLVKQAKLYFHTAPSTPYAPFTIIPLSVKLANFDLPNQPQKTAQAQEATKLQQNSSSAVAASAARSPSPDLLDNLDALLKNATDAQLIGSPKNTNASPLNRICNKGGAGLWEQSNTSSSNAPLLSSSF